MNKRKIKGCRFHWWIDSSQTKAFPWIRSPFFSICALTLQVKQPDLLMMKWCLFPWKYEKAYYFISLPTTIHSNQPKSSCNLTISLDNNNRQSKSRHTTHCIRRKKKLKRQGDNIGRSCQIQTREQGCHRVWWWRRRWWWNDKKKIIILMFFQYKNQHFPIQAKKPA